MSFPKKLSKALGHEISMPKRQKRRLEKKPPEGISLSQWRKKKPKRGKAWLTRNQKPLETVAGAKRQIEAVSGYAVGGKAKFLALKSLLNRAYAGKRNRKVIELISKELDKIPIRWLGKKTLLKNSLSEKTQSLIEELEKNLLHWNFAKSQQIITKILRETPKKESRVVASLLESRADGAAKVISELNLIRADFVETTRQLYYTAGELLKKSNWNQKAGELFEKGDLVANSFRQRN